VQVACLLIFDPPVAAVLRVEPELRGRPLGIVDGTSIVAGWLRGSTLAQALTVEPELAVRPLSLEAVESAHAALFDVALSVSPRVHDAGLGRVFIDLAGTESLFPTGRSVRTALEARLAKVGLAGTRIGLGPTRTVALLAARHRGGGHEIARGQVADFLAPLPLDLLEPPDELEDRLSRWGIHTLGQLAQLPRAALGARLGAPGTQLARLARGEDLTPFEPASPRMRHEESASFEPALGQLEPLAFALRTVLDALCQRLSVRGLAVHELWVELELEDRRTYARRIAVGAPTLEVSVLTTLVRLVLEQAPPDAPVERLRVVASPGRVEPAQLDLFAPPLPAPAELAVTVARLEALCGPENVGAPLVEDSHRPEAVRMVPFGTRRSPLSSEPRQPPEGALLALRALRPPWRVRVNEVEGIPRKVELPRTRELRVAQHAGPWRLFGEWWGDRCFARDYFDVELADGGLYRLYHNLEGDTWFVDGIYD